MTREGNYTSIYTTMALKGNLLINELRNYFQDEKFRLKKLDFDPLMSFFLISHVFAFRLQGFLEFHRIRARYVVTATRNCNIEGYIV